MSSEPGGYGPVRGANYNRNNNRDYNKEGGGYDLELFQDSVDQYICAMYVKTL